MNDKKKQDIGVYLVMSGAALCLGGWIIQIIKNLWSDNALSFSEIEGCTMIIGLFLIGAGGFIIENSKRRKKDG